MKFNARKFLNPDQPREPLCDKIENLSLYDLRKYACPKVSGSNEWYVRCELCPGLEGCKVGTRALNILKEDAKLTDTNNASERIEENVDISNEQKANNPAHTNNVRTIKARATIKEIFEGKTINESVKAMAELTPNITGHGAASKIYLWAKMYKDLYEKYPQMIDVAKKFDQRAGNKFKVSDIAKNICQEQEKVNTADDEISVNDVLKEIEKEQDKIPNEEPSEIKLKFDADEKELHKMLTEQKPEAFEEINKHFTSSIVKEDLNRKMDILTKRKAELLSKLKEIDETISSITMVLGLYKEDVL